MRVRFVFLFFLLMIGYAKSESPGLNPGRIPSPPWQAYMSNPLNRVQIRLGVPNILRGPGYDVGDAPITFIKNGSNFEVLGSEQVSWETSVSNMTSYTGAGGSFGSNNQIVTSSNCGPTTFYSNWTAAIGANQIPAAPGGNATDVCGDWVTSAWQLGSTYYLMVHNEGPSNYSAPVSTTNKSMSIYTGSSPSGPWSPWVINGLSNGTVISSTETPANNTMTGIGDCSMIPDVSHIWLYAYCYQYSSSTNSNYLELVARAPANNPAPGAWVIRYNGAFSAPALNNPFNTTTQLPQADLSSPTGTYVAAASPVFNVMSVSSDHNIYIDPHHIQQGIDGIALAVSQDYVHFNFLPQALLQPSPQNYTKPPRATDLLLYPILRNDIDGSSVLNPSHFNLTYTWVSPNNDFVCRNIVVQSVNMTIEPTTNSVSNVPSVAVELARYFTSGGPNGWPARYRTSTYNPFVSMTGNSETTCFSETGWSVSDNVGYIMTSCPNSANVNQCDSNGYLVANNIEGCYANSGTTPVDDYLLKINTNTNNPESGSCPSGYTHVRKEGYLYKRSLWGGVKQVWSCQDTTSGYHWAANDSTCFGQTVIGFLGYALTK